MSLGPIRIDDLDDPRLDIFRNLKATNATRDSGLFVVEGLKLVERLETSRFPTAAIVASDKGAEAVAHRAADGVPIYLLRQELLETLVGYNFHRGVLAAGVRLAPTPLGEVVGGSGEPSTLIVAPRIDNPENLGAIIRIADVFGADGVVVGPRAPDPLSRRVLRVSMGTALAVPVVVPDDLAIALENLVDRHGFTAVATVCAGPAERLDRFQRPGRLALLLGSEGDGLEPEWLSLCSQRLTIPMRPGAESLNVAVAAGILLYALSTQSEPAP